MDSQWMKINNPFFLVGCPRSGTTLLQQLLDAHPDIAVAPETHFIRRFWLKKNEYGDLSKNENYASLLRSILSVEEFSEMGIDADVFQLKAWQINRDYCHLFSLLLSEFSKSKQATLVGEKTPNHVLYIPILKQFFPDEKFIEVFRDPRAVVNSWRNVPWSTGSIRGDTQVWKKYILAPKSSDLDTQSLFSFHYEDLVANPEQVLRQVCGFLEVSYHSDMLNFHLSKTTSVNIKREPWKENSVKPVSQSSIAKWKTALTPSMISEIELIALEQMVKLGYLPETPYWHLKLLKIVDKAKKIAHSSLKVT
jgi:hypothetical protein